MKNMTKVLSLIGLFAAFALSVQADNEINSTFATSATGTTSATVIVPPAKGPATITDLVTKIDAGLTTGTADIRTTKVRYAVTSATAASVTAIWFDNSAANVAVGTYFLVKDGSGSYQLLRASAQTTTSATSASTITSAQTVNDFVYVLNTAARRPAFNSTSATVESPKSIYLPADMPAAVTLDGNTTSCGISISGVRSAYR